MITASTSGGNDSSREEDTVINPNTMDALGWLRKHLDEDGGSDMVREMVAAFAQQLMSAEADAVCGAGYGEVSPDRVNSRNGYRERRWDTRAGTIELAIPKLREGSYFPGWLLEPRRRAEKALVAVVADCYLPIRLGRRQKRASVAAHVRTSSAKSSKTASAGSPVDSLRTQSHCVLWITGSPGCTCSSKISRATRRPNSNGSSGWGSPGRRRIARERRSSSISMSACVFGLVIAFLQVERLRGAADLVRSSDGSGQDRSSACA